MPWKRPVHGQAERRMVRRESQRLYDERRGSPVERGYDCTWRRLRLMVLARDPLCRLCGAPATDVDHIRPLAQGGTNEDGNLRALCHACHSRKTVAEDGGFGVVTAAPKGGVGPSLGGEPVYRVRHISCCGRGLEGKT